MYKYEVIIHPRRASDLDLRVRYLEIVMAALDWYLDQAQPALFLHPEKIADSFGVQRPPRRPSMPANLQPKP